MDGLRSALSGFLLVVATVLGVVAICAIWAERQLLDTDVWTEHAVTVVHDPAVERVTAGFLAQQVVAQQAAALKARDLLPAQLQALADAPAAKAERVVQRTALRTIRAGTLDAAWAATMRSTHAEFTRWLDIDHVDEHEVDVAFDLEPLVVETARAAGVPDPVIEIGAERVDASVPLIEHGQYDRARRDAVWLRDRAALVAPLALFAAALSVLVAPRRKRATVRVGLGALLSGVTIVVAAPRLGDRFVSAMTGDGAAPAVAGAIWASVEPPLTQLGWIVAAAGLGLAVSTAVLWPSGRSSPSSTASRTRRHPSA